MKNILSRGPKINTEQCVENVGGSRFDLVLIASARARELAARHRASGAEGNPNAPVTALLDIQCGHVGIEYLKRVR